MRIFKDHSNQQPGWGPWFHTHLWPLVLCLVCLGRAFFWVLMLTQEKAHLIFVKNDVEMILPQVKTCHIVTASVVAKLSYCSPLLWNLHMHTHTLPNTDACLLIAWEKGKRALKRQASLRGSAHSLSLIEFLHSLFSLLKFFHRRSIQCGDIRTY